MTPSRSAYRLAAGALFLLLLGFVLWGSLTRVQAPGGGHYDKLQHFVAYALLTAAATGALPHRPLLVVAAVTVIGGAVEILQATLPLGRSGSVLDLAANVGGAALAALLCRLAARRVGR